MDPFRVPSGPLCPTCLVPHFPFCHPIPIDRPFPPFLPPGAHPLGQPFRGPVPFPEHSFRLNHPADHQSILSNFPAGRNEPFTDNFATKGDRFAGTMQRPLMQLQSAEAFLSGPPMPVHFPTGHPAFPHMGSQHALALEQHFSRSNLMTGNSPGHTMANNWDKAKERETQWFSQKKRPGENIERVPQIGVESRDHIIPESPMRKVARLDGIDNVSSGRHNSDWSSQPRGFGSRGDAHKRAGEGDKSKTETDITNVAKELDTFNDRALMHGTPFLQDTNAQPLSETMGQASKQGFSKIGYVSNGEPKSGAHQDRKLSVPHMRVESLSQAISFGPPDNTGRQDTYPERSHSHNGAGPSQLRISETGQSTDDSGVSYHGPDNVNSAKSSDIKRKFGQERKGKVPKEEEHLIDHGLQTFEGKSVMSREEELLIQHGLQEKALDSSRSQLIKDSKVEPAAQKDKRKHELFQQEPMSREEELLMEQGLMDDSSTSSESPTHQPFVDKQADDRSSLQNKQRLPGKEHWMPFLQSGLHHSFHHGKQEGEGIGLHHAPISNRQKDESGLSHPAQKLEPFLIGNEGIQKWDNNAGRSSTGRFMQNNQDKVSTSRPSGVFPRAEEGSVRPVPHDFLIDTRGNVSSGEGLYTRVLPPLESDQSSERRPFLQTGKVNPYDMEDVKRRKEILHMQYQEWEAEQQHMEALKRAEELAREIQQRDENLQHINFSQSGPMQDTYLQQQHPIDKRDQSHYPHQNSKTYHDGSKLQHSSQAQPVMNVTEQNIHIPPTTFSTLPFQAKSDVLEQQPSAQLSNFFQQSSMHRQTYDQDPQLQKQLTMIQSAHDSQPAGKRQQTNFEQKSQAEHSMQNTVPFPSQQSAFQFPSTHRQYSKAEVPPPKEQNDLSQRKHQNEGWQAWQHRDGLDQKNIWPAPQSHPPMLPPQKSHSGVQSSPLGNNSFQLMTQPQQQWQRQQHQQHQSQQHQQYQHSDEYHYPPQRARVQPHLSAMQEGHRTVTDGGLSLSQSHEKYVNENDGFLSLANRHNLAHQGAVQEPHKAFPVLPSTASADPLSHNSPPPLPPSICPPLPPEVPQPAPPVSSLFPSAVTPGPSSHLQHSLDAKGQSLQIQQGQNSLLQNQSSGPHEMHRLQQTVGQFGNLPSQFAPHPSHLVERFKIVDAVNILRKPGRASRPGRFAVILRGLPGSGKSYLAKALRDVEVMNGGSAPRIHSMDDYFMSEVEKVEEDESATSTTRSKKKIVQRVMEYCYEPEMEEAYRASMLKAFKKTLEEGLFNFVIVDDRNVLVADFAQFWAIAKRSGYEVYILEAPYSDTVGCAARNVHGFTLEQIQSMADRWEPTPLLYLRLDVSSLFRGDDLSAQDIIEVEMDADDIERDMEDEDEDIQPSELGEQAFASSYSIGKEKAVLGDRWEDKDEPTGNFRPSAKPKQLTERSRSRRDKGDGDISNALSGLMKAYGRKDKFVRWSDNQDAKGSTTGFSIGVPQKKGHLVIGPGPGYNEVTNPVLEETPKHPVGTPVRKNVKFLEQLRAEQEAFRAVFARRRQRIGGMEDDED